VDPVTDTPPVLATYAAKFGADPARWSFLTGPVDDVRAAVVGGFQQVMESTGVTGDPATILHGFRFVVVDRAGHMRAFVDPMEPGAGTLYATIDAAREDRLVGRP
jgi:protein SCO1/2